MSNEVKKIVLVLAGNYRQYLNFIHDNKLNPKLFRYISNKESLFDYYRPKVLKIGTWWERSDKLVNEVEDTAEIINLKDLKEDINE